MLQRTLTFGRLVRSQSSRRAVALYLTVLGTASIITVIALAAMSTVRSQARAGAEARDVSEAGVLAMSALEHAFNRLQALTVSGNPTWRTSLTSNTVAFSHSLGRGTISWKVVDEYDGNLANNPADPVRIYGIGQVGSVTRVCSVKACVGVPLNCLSVVIVGSSRVDLQACKLEYSIVSPK